VGGFKGVEDWEEMKLDAIVFTNECRILNRQMRRRQLQPPQEAWSLPLAIRACVFHRFQVFFVKFWVATDVEVYCLVSSSCSSNTHQTHFICYRKFVLFCSDFDPFRCCYRSLFTTWTLPAVDAFARAISSRVARCRGTAGLRMMRARVYAAK